MAHRLRMSAELGDWLTELCSFQPASAAEVGAALVALMDADDPSGLPLLGEPPASPIDPREVVDLAYQSMLERMRDFRRTVADAATDRKHLADRLEEAPGEPDDVVGQLRQQLEDARRREGELADRGLRIQMKVDAFRAAKETAKAMYTAAEATLRIQEAIDAATGDSSVPDGDDANAAQAVAAAAASLQAVAAQAAQILRAVRDSVAAPTGTTEDEYSPVTPAEPIAGLLEARGDPLGRDVRLLLAFEPADAVLVLAVLDGEDAVTEHRAQAIELAGGLLTDVRAGDWPPADALSAADLEVTFADAAAFLARFFPADGDAITERAAALSLAQSLAGLRQRNGMSLADLAVETGIDEARLRFIEDGGLRVAQVHEAVAYVRAVGGRLILSADVGEPAPVVLT
jgi:phage shock protein A